ncbi:hypothetical protein HO133_000049 [Letharia lupina]|uniref:Elongator complex protein 5 n=1 Tax=Letharia lupina TaxID=560253 RepID=A0A8H6FCB0_9LECA|nr:uncharacterized protein HO133_000049 [Letharia lupina]KAF6223207.1 hypothetical protein HO133_000049 [Letharia lupina]
MSDRALQHRRVHNLLLIQKLLASRDASSPFTLVLDSVEQSAGPLVRHYIHHAKASKMDVVFVSYESLKPPADVTALIKARGKDPSAVRKEIERCVSSSRRTLLILDSLYPLTTHPSLPLSSFLSSLPSPTTSLLAIYHTDVPLPSPSLSLTTTTTSSIYTPSPLTLLRYLATTVLTTHSFSQMLARKRAKEKSRPDPLFGTDEGKEGVLVGVGANDKRACVVEMEHRRKSGRGVEEWFFLPEVNGSGGVVLLEDQELYRRSDDREGRSDGVEARVELATFELGLTAKQRRDREGVVLPYFDAQKGAGGGGGRILYDMGVEDDFDEEEDEI